VSNSPSRRNFLQGFSDAFAATGVILALALIAALSARKVMPGAGAGAQYFHRM